MTNTKDDEANDWIGHECITGEQCPIAGYWEQTETKNTVWHEHNEIFPELRLVPYKKATYKYLGKTKPK